MRFLIGLVFVCLIVFTLMGDVHGDDDVFDCVPCSDILLSEISDVPWVPVPPGAQPKVIYGEDDRIDVYEETDPQRLAWTASTCALIDVSRMTQQPDGSWIISSPGAYIRGDRPACEWEPFGDQPTAAFCSGFVVGEDLIATAGHCYNTYPLGNVLFVFGFRMLDATTPRLAFLESEVYQGVEFVSRESSGNLDHCIVRVDRPITAPGAVPLPLRRHDVIQPGTFVGVIGHPSGLPMKIAFGNTFVRDASNPYYFVANLDTYGGNSGSPVFNAAGGIVEGILVRGAPDFILRTDCFESNVYDNDGGRGEDVTKTTVFAEAVPPIEEMCIFECGDVYGGDGTIAWDLCYEEIPEGLPGVNAVPDAVGVYTVTYTVSDPDKNGTEEALLVVYVEDTMAPDIFLGAFDVSRYNENGFLLQQVNTPFIEPDTFLVFDACDGDLGLPQDPGVPGNVFALAWLLDDEGELQWQHFSDTTRMPELRAYSDFTTTLGNYLLIYIVSDSVENVYPAFDGFGLPPVYDPVDGSAAFLDGEGNVKPELDFVRLVRVVATLPLAVDAVGNRQVAKGVGDSVIFTIMVSNEVGPLTYQWYRVMDNEIYDSILDAVEPTLSLHDITEADAGAYVCEVTDTGNDTSAWSPVFTLHVYHAVHAVRMLGLLALATAAALAGVVRMKKKGVRFEH